MVRVNARYQKGQLVLEQPLDLPDGTEVVVEIDAIGGPIDELDELGLDTQRDFKSSQQWKSRPEYTAEQEEQQAWERACSRLEEELEIADPSYDDWRKVYSVSHPHKS